MPSGKFVPFVLLGLVLANPMFAATPPLKSNTDFTVTLDAPGIDSATAQKGDEIRTTVVKPEEFSGYQLVGRVNSAKSTGKVKGTSMLSFAFLRLEKGSEQIPISGTLKQVTNSKGAADVDEEGRAIRKKNNTGKVAGGAALGALVGGLRGGAKGALIGAAIGGAASLVAVEIVAETGADFKLDPNSQMLVSVSPERPKEEVLQKSPQAAMPAHFQPSWYAASLQKFPGAKAFVVRHDHGSLEDNDGKYCEGVLYIFPDHTSYEVSSSKDGRSDPFDLAFTELKEVKTNFMPIDKHNAFHLRLSSGTSLNFTAPTNEVAEILTAFPVSLHR